MFNARILDEISEIDTRCGIGWFSPKWMQIFASKKAFVVVYALAGMQMHVLSSYYIGVMSTTEKNFNMSTRLSGKIILEHSNPQHSIHFLWLKRLSFSFIFFLT